MPIPKSLKSNILRNLLAVSVLLACVVEVVFAGSVSLETTPAYSPNQSANQTFYSILMDSNSAATNGVVYQASPSATNGSISNVTWTFSGNPTNGTGNGPITVFYADPTNWGELNSNSVSLTHIGTNGSPCDGGSGPVQSVIVAIPVIQIYTGSMNDYETLNSTNNSVLVGQQVNLSLYLDDPSGQITNNATYQWALPTDCIYSFNQNASSYPVVTNQPDQLTDQDVTFYFVAASGNQTVTCSINGVTISGTINVVRPTINETAANVGSVRADDLYGGNPDVPTLYYGSSSNMGIKFSADSLQMSTGAGTNVWGQVVVSRVVTLAGTNTIHNDANARDNAFPYPNLNNSTDPSSTSDSPSQSLQYTNGTNVASPASYNAQFSMYAMFIPSYANSIYVPLDVISWSWQGVATNTGDTNMYPVAQGWALVNGSTNISSPGQNVTNEPNWTSYLTNNN